MNNLNNNQKKAIKKITSGSRTQPILKNCLIKGGKLITTDLENYLIIDNYTAEDHIINADHLIKLNNINNIIINDKINYITDTKEVNFAKTDIDQFPELPNNEFKYIGKFLQTDINTLYKNRAFISKDEMKASLQYIEIRNNYYNITDGYRLKRNLINSKFSNKFYINKKCIELIKILGFCEVYISDNWVKYQFDEMSLLSRNLNNNYPDVTTVIPDNFQGSTKLNKLDLINAINQISDYSDKKNLIKLDINGSFNLSTYDSESQSGAKTEITHDKTGVDLTAGYNYKFLLDILKSYKSNNLIINYNQPRTAVIINNSDNSNLSLLMPIKLY